MATACHDKMHISSGDGMNVLVSQVSTSAGMVGGGSAVRDV